MIAYTQLSQYHFVSKLARHLQVPLPHSVASNDPVSLKLGMRNDSILSSPHEKNKEFWTLAHGARDRSVMIHAPNVTAAMGVSPFQGLSNL